MAVGGEGADAANLDGDAGEVGEAANSKGADGKAARIEGVLECGEVEVADEFREYDSFAEGLADFDAVGPRHAHEERKGGVEPAEQHIDGDGIGNAGPLLGLGDEKIKERDGGGEADEHGEHVEGELHAIAGTLAHGVEGVSGFRLHIALGAIGGFAFFGFGQENF